MGSPWLLFMMEPILERSLMSVPVWSLKRRSIDRTCSRRREEARRPVENTATTKFGMQSTHAAQNLHQKISVCVQKLQKPYMETAVVLPKRRGVMASVYVIRHESAP